jgi:conserved oligomeric Golgi complex subunit 5
MDNSHRGGSSHSTAQAQLAAANTSSSSGGGNDPAAAQAAATSLQLLLRENPGLVQHGLTVQAAGKNPDAVAFPYAAALLVQTTTTDSSNCSPEELATAALQDVERKLALTESLAVKLSRTSPEAVTGHLLRLHGYSSSVTHYPETGTGTTTTSSSHGKAVLDTMPSSTATAETLAAIRDRAVRLERQAEGLEVTARRVETSLTKGLHKMKSATQKLERVLAVSSALKMILRLQFESAKLLSYDLDDVRDLTRAAASVAVLEDLLRQPQFAQTNKPIAVVERMRPAAVNTARAVRLAASKLLQEQHAATNLHQLGAVLQVYYHLNELPTAVWKAVDQAHAQAVTATRQLWNPVTLQQLQDQVVKLSKQQQSSSGSGQQRDVAKQWKQVRAATAVQWAQGVLEAAVYVRNLHRVLVRKTDAVTRTLYVNVVAASSIPPAYQIVDSSSKEQQQFSLFALFWGRVCQSLAVTIESVLQHGNLVPDVAALYPAVRAAALEMVGHLQESSNMSSTPFLEDSSSTFTSILGGSAVLNDAFLDWNIGNSIQDDSNDNPQAAASADSWTVPAASTDVNKSQQLSQRFLAPSNATSAAVIHSQEWKTLQGGGKAHTGLYPLQKAFLSACQDRLTAPLQYMFPENVAMDDEGVTISSGLSLLPSKYDIQRFDENIRQELSLADPREGGGDLTAVTMIAECIVSMISEFCVRAKNAMSGAGESGYLESDWSMTENLQHDRKVVAIMYTLKTYLQNAPEKTLVAPYRPAVLPQHIEAANVCTEALAPALTAIDNTVKFIVLLPLCRALNRRIATVLAKMHSGVYLDSPSSTGDSIEDDNSPSFVQKELTYIFDMIEQKHLAKFPPAYASVIASNSTAFTIYTFLSNASLVRPLGESARLHITQDLADLELALEQLVSKAGGTLTLNHIEHGKPYAELRAVRQMLFWTGLDNKGKPADEVAKSLLREVWTKDMRASTMFHYLFSFGPSTLSSPYHAKRTTAAEYVNSLIQLDGSVMTGEDTAWMTIMSCCDSYVQRASAGSAAAADNGDPRVAQIVMTLGQELLRRRGRN